MSKDKKFNSIIEELNHLKKQLSEDYFFGDEEGGMQDPNAMGQQMPPQENSVNPALVQPQQSQQMMGNCDSEEEIAMHAQEIIQHEPIVGKIRETAIEGLRKDADHPTSDLYSFFKDVFLSSDKLLTNKGK
jgi:hypothetical protein